MFRFWQLSSVRVLIAFLAVSVLTTTGWLSFSATVSAHKTDQSSCDLNGQGGKIKHVLYFQFDNVHFTRDNPNVPSDLAQMPNLLHFLANNGSLLTNHHTPLISHTATNILTSLTGVYPDQHGVAVSNSYRYFNPDGTTTSTPAFTYWTSPVATSPASTDTSYNMLSASHKNAPAPWVPFTRAGCNVGAVATANTVVENPALDIPVIYGANSPEAAELKSNSALATADFEGIAVHCAKDNAVCSDGNHGRPDLLPDEPGGYSGYNALFGHKYVAPVINPDGPVTDLNGKVITDSKGNPGFPGFDGMAAANSLAYVADMQEHEIPVTYAYLSDVHDNHDQGRAFGPGEAGYVTALQAYDEAFGAFFARLQKDGINKNNTLFVFTADEGDHFVGGAPSPADCDGVNVPCTYSQIGEVNTNLTGLLATEKGITTPFTVHADSAPAIYLTGNPARDADVTRTFDRALAGLTATNPLTGQEEKVTNYLADAVELQALHMITADPARTPTVIQFAKPDYYLYAGKPDCNTPCVALNPAFAWNHGDVDPEITTTWLGLVGPGVQHLGATSAIWSDHTDTRPTILELVGLKDDYQHDGRVLFEALTPNALPTTVRRHLAYYTSLAQLYKQLNAPLGAFGQETLHISTAALASESEGDQTYKQLEDTISSLTTTRNTIAQQIINLLESAEFGTTTHNQGAAPHTTVATQDDQSVIQQGNDLLKQAQSVQ